MALYSGTGVNINIVPVDEHEAKVIVEGPGDVLIWISRSEQPDFERELTALLDKYRI